MTKLKDNITLLSPGSDLPKVKQEITLEYLRDLYNQTIGTLNKNDGIDCELCLNRGYINQVKNDTIVVVTCNCMKKRHLAKIMKDSGLSKRYYDNTLENFVVTEKWQETIKNVVKDYLDNSKNEWLVLSGQVGSGKTHLATSVVKTLIERGHEVRYLNFAKDFVSLKKRVLSGFVDVREEAEKQELEYLTVDTLFIDDFLKGIFNVDDVFSLIDYRYANNLRTIITTEFNIKTMLQKSESVASRINEMTTDKYWVDIKQDAVKNYRLKVK